MDIRDLQSHLDGRLDRLEDKQDNLADKMDGHLERISKAEESIEWIRGHLRIGTSLVIAAITGMAGAIYHYILK
jgi:hypothetical protein